MKLPGVEFTFVPRRAYVLGRRYHHGLYGVWRVLTGVLLIALDRRDARVWVSDLLRHPDWRKP